MEGKLTGPPHASRRGLMREARPPRWDVVKEEERKRQRNRATLGWKGRCRLLRDRSPPQEYAASHHAIGPRRRNMPPPITR
eukprot:707606-Prorocentrum_minimum.AAC.1